MSWLLWPSSPSPCLRVKSHQAFDPPPRSNARLSSPPRAACTSLPFHGEETPWNGSFSFPVFSPRVNSVLGLTEDVDGMESVAQTRPRHAMTTMATTWTWKGALEAGGTGWWRVQRKEGDEPTRTRGGNGGRDGCVGRNVGGGKDEKREREKWTWHDELQELTRNDAWNDDERAAHVDQQARSPADRVPRGAVVLPGVQPCAPNLPTHPCVQARQRRRRNAW